MARNYLDPGFVSLARETIITLLPEGSLNTVTRKELCNKLDLDQKDSGVFSRMLDFGLLSEFEDRGPVGIGRKGAARPKSAEVLLTPAFLDKLQKTLNEKVLRGAPLTREQLALAMNEPLMETMEKISLAFKHKKIDGFALKKGHGIVRL